MMTLQKGFTLIELMIVIAIIGILAAIALPAYQDYVARAQATEAFVATSGLRTDIGLHYWVNREFPDATDTVMTQASELDGKYFAKGGVTITPLSGIITVAFDEGVNKNKTVTIIPVPVSVNGQIKAWDCVGSISPTRLPNSCQK